MNTHNVQEETSVEKGLDELQEREEQVNIRKSQSRSLAEPEERQSTEDVADVPINSIHSDIEGDPEFDPSVIEVSSYSMNTHNVQEETSVEKGLDELQEREEQINIRKRQSRSLAEPEKRQNTEDVADVPIVPIDTTRSRINHTPPKNRQTLITIQNSMYQQDQTEFYRALSLGINSIRSWKSTISGNHYTVTQIKDYIETNRLCRKYSIRADINGSSLRAEGIACRRRGRSFSPWINQF